MRGVVVHECFKHEDARGWLLKAVKKDYAGDAPFGEIYLVSGDPGVVRANHYHNRTTEWFCVVKGKGTLSLQDTENSESPVEAMEMDASRPVCVRIPPRIAHAIENSGDGEMILLAFADVPYDPDAPDTEPFVVVEP